VDIVRVGAGLNYVVWIVGSCWVFYEREMGKESGNGH